MKKNFTYFLFLLFTASQSFSQSAGDYKAVGGMWDDPAAWQTYTGSKWLTATSAPNSTNDVYLNGWDDVLITIPAGYSASCASLTIGVSNHHNHDVFINGTSTLNVTGNIVIERPNATCANELNIGGGTVTVGGSVSFSGTNSNNTRLAKITITTGTLNIGGDLNLTAPSSASILANQIDMSGGAGVLNLAGALSITDSGGGSLLPGTTSIFNYNGSSSAQTVLIGVPNFAYNHLHVNNTNMNGATLSAAVTASNVMGNIRIQSGKLSNGGFAIAMAASKTFEVGANANFYLTGTSGMATGTSLTKTFGTNSTVYYNGANQPVSGESYYHLVTGGSGTKTLAGAVTTNGNITIGSGTTLDASASSYAMNIKGNWINDGTLTPQNGTITFMGTAQQSVSGNTSTTFKNLEVNNSSGILFSASQNVGGLLTFTNGTITTSSLNLLTMNAGSSVTGAGIGKYVIGPVKKTGNTAFTFPLGKGSLYAPCGISAPANLTDAFTAEYMRANPKSLGSAIFNEQIKQLSVCEYWNLNRTTGTSAVNVILTWSGTSPCNPAAYIDNLSSLTIAHFNGAGWDKHGNSGGTTGNVSNGTITWNNVTSFSPFTFASTSNFNNPLPVKFDNIKATDLERGVLIDWSILTEINVDHYEIERSVDNRQFITIRQMEATNNFGDKSNYNWLDQTVEKQVYFYRVKAVDIKGEITYSSIAKINRGGAATEISIYPNPILNGVIAFQSDNLVKGIYTVNIINNAGLLIYKKEYNHAGGVFKQKISGIKDLKSGLYALRVNIDGVNIISKLFIVD